MLGMSGSLDCVLPSFLLMLGRAPLVRVLTWRSARLVASLGWVSPCMQVHSSGDTLSRLHVMSALVEHSSLR